MRRPLLPLLLVLSAPGLAGCLMKQTPPDQVTRAQSPDYVDFWDNDRPTAAPKPPAPVPPGQYLKHPPQYFPPDPVFPLQREPLVVPKFVAPPTPAQVEAVSPDVVKFLQTGAFDPNPTPATARAAPPAAPTNPLEGTVWVRETKGCRVTLTFTKDRLDADVTAADGVSLAVAADYALGRDGLVFGVVTEAASPQAGEGGLAAKLLAADGAPYCFRVRTEGGTLTVRDLRCGGVEATYAVVGVYKKTTAADLAKLPPVARPLPAELNRLELPREADGRERRVAAAPRSSLEVALESVQAFAVENPQLVQLVAAEVGQAVGGWVGDQTGQPRLGEVVGRAIGSAIAAKLTGRPAPPAAEPADLRSARALSYWLGAKRPAEPTTPVKSKR